MPCSLRAALASLYYVITTLKFFFLLFYLFALFLAKLFTSVFSGVEDENYDSMEYEEEVKEEEEEEYEVDEEDEESVEIERDESLVADILNQGEDLLFVTQSSYLDGQCLLGHEYSRSYEAIFADDQQHQAFDSESSESNIRDTPSFKLYNHDHDHNNEITSYEVIEENHVPTFSKPGAVSEITTNTEKQVAREEEMGKNEEKQELNFTKDEKFLNFRPPKSEARKLQVLDEEKDNDIFGDTYTVGSTSKSSSDWRGSIRDFSTDHDMFSSSSRRSCHKWESYTLYHKYEEEMLYQDRIYAQKLHEAESQKMVQKVGNKKKCSDGVHKKTYRDLEAAYVAQICVTWEALNWNYANFMRKIGSKVGANSGCPAIVAQEFQHFQVLLQRYIENEPYEQGRRPQVYARMRRINSKLLQVPEYQDYEDEQKEEVGTLRVSSESFKRIVEDSIQTYMKFLEADRESPCQLIASLLRPRPRGTIDPALIQLVNKNNKKKKVKVKELRRPRSNCLKISKLPRDKEMEILMSLIDLKVVSRVLRMKHITKEQLQWCEAKITKIRISHGKLLRDPSPLFYPSH